MDLHRDHHPRLPTHHPHLPNHRLQQVQVLKLAVQLFQSLGKQIVVPVVVGEMMVQLLLLRLPVQQEQPVWSVLLWWTLRQWLVPMGLSIPPSTKKNPIGTQQSLH
jgi:hypothetical protein